MTKKQDNPPKITGGVVHACTPLARHPQRAACSRSRRWPGSGSCQPKLRDNTTRLSADVGMNAFVRRSSACGYRSYRDIRCWGAGVLRSFQGAGVQLLEVTGPDKHDRRARGKSDTLDAEAAAHAAYARKRTVTPKTRDGMIEALRVLRAVRKTAVQARRIALQMIRWPTVECRAFDERREYHHLRA